MKDVTTLPDFIIIGAAKAGTTSLFHYLGQHPAIYTSIKEPNFFSWNAVNRAGLTVPGNGPGDSHTNTWIPNLAEYQLLFRNKSTTQLAGEASVSYLYSPVSARAIRHAIPHAKLIVILRNPVERAWSQYQHHKRDMREPLDFQAALDAEEERIKQGWSYGWHYKKVGLYGKQLKRFYDVFPQHALKIFRYEDFQTDAREITEQALSFLGLTWSNNIETTTVHNPSGDVKSKLLATLLNRPSNVRTFIRNLLPPSLGHHVMDRLRKANLKQGSAMPAKSCEYLYDYYSEDIALTEQLTGLSLKDWRGG